MAGAEDPFCLACLLSLKPGNLPLHALVFPPLQCGERLRVLPLKTNDGWERLDVTQALAVEPVEELHGAPRYTVYFGHDMTFGDGCGCPFKKVGTTSIEEQPF